MGGAHSQPGICKHCHRRHWNLIRCEDAEASGVPLEDDRLADMEFKRLHPVIPQARTRPALSRAFRGTNFVETAPGVFHRKRVR